MNDVNIYAKIAKELGVRSYPSLVMVVNEETSLISSGDLPFEEVRALIKKNYWITYQVSTKKFNSICANESKKAI